jgi:hypothetical protein
LISIFGKHLRGELKEVGPWLAVILKNDSLLFARKKPRNCRRNRSTSTEVCFVLKLEYWNIAGCVVDYLSHRLACRNVFDRT